MNQFADVLPYLRSIRDIPRIDTNECNDTIALYMLTKSIKARNRIIEYYLPLVPQLMSRYIGQGIDTNDLIQEANVRLVEIISSLHKTRPGNTTAFIITSINNRIISLLRHINQ